MTMNFVVYHSIRLKEIISVGGKALHTSVKSKLGVCIASAIDDLQAQSADLNRELRGKNIDANCTVSICFPSIWTQNLYIRIIFSANVPTKTRLGNCPCMLPSMKLSL